MKESKGTLAGSTPIPKSSLVLCLLQMVIRPEVDSRLCFVLTPFKEPFNRYYRTLLKPALASEGFRCIRADGIYGQQVMGDIWDSIWKAKVVIADVTNKNPNVNYELGLCHALGVPTVIITQNRNHVPFDYRYRRHILYTPKRNGWRRQLQTDLINHVKAVLQDSSSRDRMLIWPEAAKLGVKPQRTAKAWLVGNRPFLLDVPRVPFSHRQNADFVHELIPVKSKGFRLKIAVPKEHYWRCGFVLAPEDYIQPGRTDVRITQYFLFHIGRGASANPTEPTDLNYHAYFHNVSERHESFLSDTPVEIEARFAKGHRGITVAFGDKLYEKHLDPRYLRHLYILAWADWFSPFHVEVQLTSL